MKASLLFIVLFLSLGFINSLQAVENCKGPTGGTPGQCAPDFTLKSMDGKEVRLADYRGKILFLNFWATWCQPCIDEIPSLIKAHEKLKGSAVEMLSVSMDTEGKEAIDGFFKKHFGGKYPPYPNLMDTNKKISMHYGTFKVPETYIIDKTGRVRDKIEGVRDWEDSIVLHYLELLSKE